jgi:hypothetical protein
VCCLSLETAFPSFSDLFSFPRTDFMTGMRQDHLATNVLSFIANVSAPSTPLLSLANFSFLVLPPISPQRLDRPSCNSKPLGATLYSPHRSTGPSLKRASCTLSSALILRGSSLTYRYTGRTASPSSLFFPPVISSHPFQGTCAGRNT